MGSIDRSSASGTGPGIHQHQHQDQQQQQKKKWKRRWLNPLVFEESSLDHALEASASGSSFAESKVARPSHLATSKETLNPLYDQSSALSFFLQDDQKGQKKGERQRQGSSALQQAGHRRKYSLALSLAALFCLFATSLNCCEKFVRHFAGRAQVGHGEDLFAQDVEELKSFLSFVSEEKMAYEQCIDRQFHSPGGCHNTLNHSAAADMAILEKQYQDARRETNVVREVVSEWSDHYQKLAPLIEAAERELLHSVNSPFTEVISRSAANRHTRSDQPVENNNDEFEQLSSKNDTIREETATEKAIEDAFVEIEKDLSARHQYDKLYMQRKVEALTSQLDLSNYLNESLVHPLGDLGTGIKDMLSVHIEDTFISVGAFIQNVSLQYDLLQGELRFFQGLNREVFGQMEQMVREMQEFERAVKAILKPLKTVLPQLPFPEVHLGLPNQDLYEIRSPLMLTEYNISRLESLDLLDEISLKINVTKANALDMIRDITEEANFEIGTGLSGLISDYNPPNIRLNFHQKHFENLLQMALTRNALLPMEQKEAHGKSKSTESFVSSIGGTFSRARSSMESQFFSFDADFADIDRGVHFFFKCVLALDICYRIFSALYTICKYWTASSIDKPKLILKVRFI